MRSELVTVHAQLVSFTSTWSRRRTRCGSAGRRSRATGAGSRRTRRRGAAAPTQQLAIACPKSGAPCVARIDSYSTRPRCSRWAIIVAAECEPAGDDGRDEQQAADGDPWWTSRTAARPRHVVAVAPTSESRASPERRSPPPLLRRDHGGHEDDGREDGAAAAAAASYGPDTWTDIAHWARASERRRARGTRSSARLDRQLDRTLPPVDDERSGCADDVRDEQGSSATQRRQ